MWAMIVKEFRQIRRDRRTLVMMILMPIVLLVVLGYAASFDVTSIPVAVAGPQASAVAGQLPKTFHIVSSAPGQGRAWALRELRDGHAAVAVLTGGTRPDVLIDGTQLFTGAGDPDGPGPDDAHRGTCGADRAAGVDSLQSETDDVRRHDSGPGRRRPGVHRDDHHQPRRRARAAVRHARAARRHAAAPARRLPRQDRPVLRRGRRRPGHRARGGHRGVRRAVPRLGGRVRARRPAVLVRHPRYRRADLERVAEPGPGHPAGGDDDAAAGAAVRADLPAVLDRRRACAGSPTCCR